MNFRSEADPVRLSISAVERDTGLGKDTLRVWERRYGFPTPDRDAFGERVYTLVQVEKLRIIKRLMDQGHRPGRIVALPIEELQRLSQGLYAAPQNLSHDASPAHADLDRYLDLMRRHDAEGLRQSLSQALAHEGLKHFVTQVAAPLISLVGDAWMRGELEIHEEHLFTECITGLMRQAIGAVAESTTEAKPLILLTTFPQESHGLGLLMAECMMVLQGARCLSLGTQTPLRDIVQAAQAHRVDVVALSFSATMNPNHVLDGLAELRRALPADVEIWAGGRCPILRRRRVEGVQTLHDLEQVGAEVKRWVDASA
jgi:DNA-binding transcriptional MerR regulator/methylmalonyl-CoA mutase cobalamin-binding subunit